MADTASLASYKVVLVLASDLDTLTLKKTAPPGETWGLECIPFPFVRPLEKPRQDA